MALALRVTSCHLLQLRPENIPSLDFANLFTPPPLRPSSRRQHALISCRSEAMHERRFIPSLGSNGLPQPGEIRMGMLTEIDYDQAFENTSTSVAASQMRNALNGLSDTVKDPVEKKASPSPIPGFVCIPQDC